MMAPPISLNKPEETLNCSATSVISLEDKSTVITKMTISIANEMKEFFALPILKFFTKYIRGNTMAANAATPKRMAVITRPIFTKLSILIFIYCVL